MVNTKINHVLALFTYIYKQYILNIKRQQTVCTLSSGNLDAAAFSSNFLKLLDYKLLLMVLFLHCSDTLPMGKQSHI